MSRTFFNALVLALVLLGSAVSSSSAATIFAASASRADVGAAVASASSGDTVSVPAGSATWGTTLLITKGITLQGAGIGLTVITSTVSPGYYSFLIDYRPASPALNEPFRLTGFELNGNWTSGGVFLENTTTDSTKPLTKIRVDHNYIHDCGNSTYSSRAILANGMAWGVIDHNTFRNNQKTFDDELSDNVGWGAAFAPGSANYMYFEDNIVTNADSRSSLITSGGQGGRYVVRYNTIDTVLATGSGQHYDIHGTLSDRGTVGAEIYNNTLRTRTGSYQFLDHRGGTAMVFNNRVIKAASDITIQLREEDTGTYPLLDQVKNSYYWNNTYGTTTGLESLLPAPFVSDGAAYVQLGRDYFTPANGLEAARPASCAAGALYAAKDTGKVFKCITANSWTVLYQPYTYPHPLVTGGGGTVTPPTAPSNIRVIR